jgi:hypothetical protein
MRAGQGLLAAALILGLAAPAAKAAEPAANVSIHVTSERIEFRHGKRLVTTYHLAASVAKPYFYPVNSPAGVPLTRGWPMVLQPNEQLDHVHQKSAWFCHGDVIAEGIPNESKIKGIKGIDFWSEAPGHGRIVCTSVETPMMKKDHAWVVTHNEWRTSGGKKVLDETRTIHLYDIGPAQLIVMDSDLLASTTAVTFGDTKEGSFGVRVRKDLTEAKGKGRLTNAEGHVGEGKNGNRDKKGCWGLVSDWCDYSGKLDGKERGLTIFADPSNPYPSAWHARGYGLMAANPFGRGKSGYVGLKGRTDLVKLAKGEHLKLRYGLYLHEGDVKAGKVAEAYKRFVKLGKSEERPGGKARSVDERRPLRK